MEVDQKVQEVLLRFESSAENVINDDTIQQKLQTLIHRILQGKNSNQLAWAQKVGLLDFIENTLKILFHDEKTINRYALSLSALSSLLENEDSYNQLISHKIMDHLLLSLPAITNNMSLSFVCLKVFQSIVSHYSGKFWVLDRGLWNKLLIPCLMSPSLFVRKQAVKCICSLLLSLQKSQAHRSTKMIDELGNLLLDSYEINYTGSKSTEENTGSLLSNRRDISTLLLSLFYQLSTQMCEETGDRFYILSIITRLSHHLLDSRSKISSEDLILTLKLLLLCHMDQNIGNCSTALPSDCNEHSLLHLVTLMIDSDRFSLFVQASFSVYQRRSSFEDISTQSSHIGRTIFRLQILALLSVSLSCQKWECKEEFIFSPERLRHKLEMKMPLDPKSSEEQSQIEEQIATYYQQTPQELDKMCMIILSQFSAVVHLLDQDQADMLCDLVSSTLQCSYAYPNLFSYNSRLQQTAIDVLTSLVNRLIWFEQANINVEVPLIWKIVSAPGTNTLVKTAALKTIKAYLGKITIVQNQNAAIQYRHILTLIGQQICVFLSDMTWEVRDSSLEVLTACTNYAKENLSFYVEWFKKHKFLSAVFIAVGDSEPYVQGSALLCLSHLVYVDKLWAEMKGENMKQHVVACVLNAGEQVVRRAGLELLSALLISNRFKNQDVDSLVIPVVGKTTTDADDEIRLKAVQIIGYLFKSKLPYTEDMEDHFTSIDYLGHPECKEESLKSIWWLCESGYFSALIAGAKDPATKVILEAKKILCFLNDMINHFILNSELTATKDRFSIEMDTEGVDTQKRKLSASSEGQMGNNNKRHLPVTSKEEDLYSTKKEGIDFVLRTSDLSAISRIETISLDESQPWWWNGDISSNKIVDIQIPPKLPSVSINVVCEQLKSHFDGIDNSCQDDFIKDGLILLEDILLDPGPSNQDIDGRLRDCY